MTVKKPIVPNLRLSDSVEPHFEGLLCSNCNAVSIDTRGACSKCYARSSLVPFKLTHTGRLYNWTIVHRNFPGIKVPFVPAIVDLDGGGTVKGNLIDIEPDPSKLAFDMPITVVFSAVAQSIKAEVYDLVLCVGVEQIGKGLLGGLAPPNGIPLEGLSGSGAMPAVFAMVGMEHARKYGTTFEQFAKVSVTNCYHSQFNPKAMYEKPASLADVMGAEKIAYPITKLMCSVNVDGIATVVLASEKKAKQLGLLPRAVRIRASTLTSDSYSERDLVMHGFNACTKLAARQAYGTAEIGPEDLDLVELHDCFHRRDTPLRKSRARSGRQPSRIIGKLRNIQPGPNSRKRVRRIAFQRTSHLVRQESPTSAKLLSIYGTKQGHAKWRMRGSA
jgi:uncharacterized OB-fold protein